MTQYRTKDGDMIDAICHKHYKNPMNAVEHVYRANPGLADYGPTLPPGLLIELPDLALPRSAPALKLWD